MAFSGLGAAVGRAVATHHLRRAVPEQVLAIELACVVRDGSGGERVAEAVGVEPSYAGVPAEPAQLVCPASPLGRPDGASRDRDDDAWWRLRARPALPRAPGGAT